jgi:hypothetical protein
MNWSSSQSCLTADIRKLRGFVDSFKLLERGYREGALAYGMIAATKA